MTVFDVFRETDYTYLKIERGKILGNVIVEEIPLKGIFKRRETQETMENMELYQSSATIHAHPEDFNNFDELVGNGIRVCGQTYEIMSMTVGTNFDTGDTEHITLTLQRAEFSDGN
jgi:hypothetical protein